MARTIVTNINDQLKRWREHFEQVLNRPSRVSQTDLQDVPLLAITFDPITGAEVKNTL